MVDTNFQDTSLNQWLERVQVRKGNRLSKLEICILMYLHTLDNPFATVDCHLALNQLGVSVRYTSLYSILRRFTQAGILMVSAHREGVKGQLLELAPPFCNII